MLSISIFIDWAWINATLSGCLNAAIMILLLGAVAVILDLIVRGLKQRGVSPPLCLLLHIATLTVAAVDIVLVLCWAVNHAGSTAFA